MARHPWIDRDAPVLTADFVAMDAGTGLVHIAPGPRRGGLRARPRARPPIYNPVDDDGRFIAEVAHFAGLTVWEANPKIIEHLQARWRAGGRGAADAHVPALLALQEPDALPRDRAVVHRARPGRAARSGRSTAIRNDVQWIPAGARSASTTWSRTARTGASRASACGACRSPPSTARAARTLVLDEAPRRARGATSSATARAPTRGSRGRRASCCPPGTRCPKCGGRGVPQGDGHPRRLVRLGLQPRRRAGAASGAALARRACTWRARTSTAAGSTPRC